MTCKPMVQAENHKKHPRRSREQTKWEIPVEMPPWRRESLQELGKAGRWLKQPQMVADQQPGGKSRANVSNRRITMIKINTKFQKGILAAILLATVSGQAAGTMLNIGSPAPAIKVEKWIKGTPVQGFEKGKVYVVEFWATWCGPCRAAMPHLSELALKYTNKVTFTGVSVFERGEGTTKKVEAFVKDMGDKMAYNVCADGSAAFMAANWMEAAGEPGIPCTFVVGVDGKIAWIGHPTKLEDVLDQVLAGTADFSDLAKTRAASRAVTATDPAAAKEIQMAIDAKDYAETVKAIDRAGATNGVVARKFQAEKLRALMFTDETKGMAFGKEILGRPMTNSTSTLDLLKAGATLAGADGLSKKAYGLAIDLMTKASEAKPVEPEPGMMRITVNTEAVNHFIETTQKKAAAAKE